MTNIIRTKFHHIQALIDKEEVYFTAPIDGTATLVRDVFPGKDVVHSFSEHLKRIEQIPHFVIDDDLIDIALKKESLLSIMDMKKAGVLRLPFPRMLVECTGDNGRGGKKTDFISLEDIHLSDQNQETVKEMVAKGMDVYGYSMTIDHDPEGAYLVVSPASIFIGTQDKDGEPWISINALTIGEDEKLDKMTGEVYKKVGGYIYRAAVAAYLLMNTDGVEREVIDTDKINRKRRNNGKPTIPRHTYIYIGRVYRSGASVESDEYIPRKSPRPHWRRGHLKSVRYGPGREKIKDVYIKPKLVAYKGDLEPQVPEYIVKKGESDEVLAPEA